MGNNSIYRIYYFIAIIVSHDFGLPILSQWQNIVLLQLNNMQLTDNITLNLEPYALKTRTRSVIFLLSYTVSMSCNNRKSPLGNNRIT